MRAAAAAAASALRRRARPRPSITVPSRTFGTPAPPLPRPAAPPTPPPLAPPSHQLRTALNDLSTLPELNQALSTPDPALSQTLLHRTLQILSPTPGGSHLAVIHACLARLHHRHGHLEAERRHRLSVLSTLSAPPSTPPPDPDRHTAVVAMSHAALALACLRGPGPEARLAAAAAAASAERLAAGPPLRTAATLAAALSAAPASRGMLTVLSALVAVDAGDGAAAPLDVPGFARVFLALHGGAPGDAVDAVDHAKALVVRWESRGGFDFVEALCVAAARVAESGEKDALEMAEDFLSRAVRVVGDIGSQLDKGEPLLALAGLFERTGRLVEAEGMYRSVEERFDLLWGKKAFTVSAADLYCRLMDSFASFLERVDYNGRTREREAVLKRARADAVRALFPEIFVAEERPCVPLWVVDSMLPHFELPAPRFESAK